MKTARRLANRRDYSVYNFEAEDVVQELMLEALVFEKRTGRKAALGSFAFLNAVSELKSKAVVVVRPAWFLKALAKSQNPDHALSKVLVPSYDAEDLEHEKEDFSFVLDAVDRLSKEEKQAIMFEFFEVGEDNGYLECALGSLREML